MRKDLRAPEPLRREVHAAQEGLEGRVGPQWGNSGGPIAGYSSLVAYCLSTNPQIIPKFWMDDGPLGKCAERVFRRIWNEKRPSMKVGVAIGGSLNWKEA